MNTTSAQPGTVGTRFVLLFPGRTGSSWLISALASHPEIEAEGEILVRQDAREQDRILDQQLAAPLAPGMVRGFKTKLKDVVDPVGFRARLEESGATIIEMRRCDQLRLAVSRLNARRLREQTGQWNRKADTRRLTAFAIEPADLEESLAYCASVVEELDAFMDGLPNPRLCVEYAEILDDGNGVLERVQSGLHLVPRTLESQVMKNTSEDLSEVVTNIEQLADHFRGGRWERCFESINREIRPDRPGG